MIHISEDVTMPELFAALVILVVLSPRMPGVQRANPQPSRQQERTKNLSRVDVAALPPLPQPWLLNGEARPAWTAASITTPGSTSSEPSSHMPVVRVVKAGRHGRVEDLIRRWIGPTTLVGGSPATLSSGEQTVRALWLSQRDERALCRS